MTLFEVCLFILSWKDNQSYNFMDNVLKPI